MLSPRRLGLPRLTADRVIRFETSMAAPSSLTGAALICICEAPSVSVCGIFALAFCTSLIPRACCIELAEPFHMGYLKQP